MSVLLLSAVKSEAEFLHRAFSWQRLGFRWGELYRYKQFFLAHPGIGKSNTAAGLALLIAELKPKRVIQFGIAGMYPGSGLEISELALAESETHIDCGRKDDSGFTGMKDIGFALLQKDKAYYNVFPVDKELKKEFISFGLEPKPFATSETITGNSANAIEIEKQFGVALESMEGAAAAQTCLALDTPFIELRAVSNVVGETNKANWRIDKAVRKLNDFLIDYLQSYD